MSTQMTTMKRAPAEKHKERSTYQHQSRVDHTDEHSPQLSLCWNNTHPAPQ